MAVHSLENPCPRKGDVGESLGLGLGGLIGEGSGLGVFESPLFPNKNKIQRLKTRLNSGRYPLFT